MAWQSCLSATQKRKKHLGKLYPCFGEEYLTHMKAHYLINGLEHFTGPRNLTAWVRDNPFSMGQGFFYFDNKYRDFTHDIRVVECVFPKIWFDEIFFKGTDVTVEVVVEFNSPFYLLFTSFAYVAVFHVLLPSAYLLIGTFGLQCISSHVGKLKRVGSKSQETMTHLRLTSIAAINSVACLGLAFVMYTEGWFSLGGDVLLSRQRDSFVTVMTGSSLGGCSWMMIEWYDFKQKNVKLSSEGESSRSNSSCQWVTVIRIVFFALGLVQITLDVGFILSMLLVPSFEPSVASTLLIALYLVCELLTGVVFLHQSRYMLKSIKKQLESVGTTLHNRHQMIEFCTRIRATGKALLFVFFATVFMAVNNPAFMLEPSSWVTTWLLLHLSRLCLSFFSLRLIAPRAKLLPSRRILPSKLSNLTQSFANLTTDSSN